jgi:asparagine synthase (glutamine-hydrolysing)
VLTGGNRIGRLVLSGQLVTAYRSLTADEEHWDDHRTPAARVRSMVGASLPAAVRRALQRHELADTPGSMPSELSPEFVARVDLAGRARASASAFDALPVRATGHQRARLMSGSMLTVGIERYDRIAGMCGVECRSPFLDRRVADVLLGLPDHVLHDRGWHKMLLRRAGAGHLPPEVRWKRGRDHLGSGFLEALGEEARARFLDDRPARLALLHPFLADSLLTRLEHAEQIDLSRDDSAAVVLALLLADWLDRDSQMRRTSPGATAV